MVFGKNVTVEKVIVPFRSLHPAMEGFKIVQLSDLHFLPHTPLSVIQQAVACVAELKPDLVVLTGDYVTHEAETIFGMTDVLGDLDARYGVFAILGNHDARTGKAMISKALEDTGITVLQNESIRFDVGHSQLLLAGVEDCIWGQPDLAAALDDQPDDVLTVLLAHEPDVIDEFRTTRRIDLQLSGHTHGGQIRLPIWGTPVLPKLGKKYVHGLYQLQDTWLYTNRGIGMVGLPIRFSCPPEVTELTLCKA
ncbi:MAG: metallophosphoesterase [Caldilineaceae bacterium]|nr:metallophosphoesterase [Caldilineaceae bacterium]